MLQYQINSQNIAVISLNNPNKSANIINAAFVNAFDSVLNEIKTITQCIGIVITSSKSTFMAGGDLEHLYNLRKNPLQVYNQAESLKKVFRKLETIGKPVVAAINGSALGGGLELALACHYRICLNKSTLQLGLPEVSLGLLPGAGGVTRMVRLLGLQTALPLLLEGKKVAPTTALSIGFIDAIAQTEQTLIQNAIDWILANPKHTQQVFDNNNYKLPGGTPKQAEVAQMLAIAPAMLVQKTQGNYPAPQAILNCAVEGTMVDFETACRIESRYFTHLLCGKVAQNMIKAFWFQLNSLQAGKSRPQNIEKQNVQKIGIIGAGMMGAGIAYSAITAGIPVVLKDISLEAAQQGKNYSVKLINNLTSKGKYTPETATAILQKITPTNLTADLHDCDLIIEAVFENRELKAQVTQQTEAIMLKNAIFASNTSTLPISGLATASKNPENFIGLHFFSPVDKMQLVEIIVGEKTSQSTLARAFDFVKQIGKIPIVVNDSRGFYTSRVFATYVLEGAAMLAEGIPARLIESAGIQAGMPVAPLALLDEVSLKLVFDIREQTRKDMEAEGKTYEKHPAYAVLYKMVVDLQRLGKKNGKGFYEYPENTPKHLWNELSTHFPSTATANIAPLPELIQRLLFIQSIETVKCLEEGVINSSADANLGSIFGWGFAPFYGGTLQFINSYGLQNFIHNCKLLTAKYGSRFMAPQLLNNMLKNEQEFE